MEQLAARWVVAFSMVLIGSFSLIRFLPSPTELPAYARFLPADSSAATDLSPDQIVGREPGATPAATAAPPPAIEIPGLGGTTATATITVESANCRDRPRGNADRVTFLYKDQELEIVGKNNDLLNPWWYVKLPDSDEHCWLWGMTATTTGPVEDLPILP
jgi:hypothetical protein